MNKIKSAIVLVLLLATPLTPYLPDAAHAATGTISFIPTGVQYIAAGTNVTLNMSTVTFSGAEFYLLWSSNGFSEISAGDFKFTPTFTVANLTQFSYSYYYSSTGNYSVGYDTITGPIPKNIAGGKYYVKCFDGSTTSLAVSNNYINVLPILEVTPFTSGAGGSPISLTGTTFTAKSTVVLTYYDPIAAVNETLATVSTNAQGNFTYATTAPDLQQWMPAGDNPITFDIIKFFSNDTATGYQAEANYMEGRRGLLQVGNVYPPSGYMFGNNTGFTTLQVYVNESLIIAGNYFHPPAVTIYFDNAAIGTVQTNSSGFFNTTVRVPITLMGTHRITLEDAVNLTTSTTTTTTTVPTTTTTTKSITTTTTTKITTTIPTTTISTVTPKTTTTRTSPSTATQHSSTTTSQTSTHTTSITSAITSTTSAITTTSTTTSTQSTKTASTSTTLTTISLAGTKTNLLIPAVLVVFIVIVAAAVILLLRSRRK